MEPDAHLWDVFISYASEDRDTVARPLAEALTRHRVRVWLDQNQLRLGDSLSRKIDEGLVRSRYGVVILSPAFFQKDWPQAELAGLVGRQGSDRKIVLPVWHGIDRMYVARFSPTLADKLASDTRTGLERVALDILDVVGVQAPAQAPIPPPPPPTPVINPVPIPAEPAALATWQTAPRARRPEHERVFERTMTLRAGGDVLGYAAFSPDGALLATDDNGEDTTGVVILNTTTGRPVARLSDYTGPVTAVAWIDRSDSNAPPAIVYGTRDGYIVEWEPQSGDPESWVRRRLTRLKGAQAGRSVLGIAAGSSGFMRAVLDSNVMVTVMTGSASDFGRPGSKHTLANFAFSEDVFHWVAALYDVGTADVSWFLDVWSYDETKEVLVTTVNRTGAAEVAAAPTVSTVRPAMSQNHSHAGLVCNGRPFVYSTYGSGIRELAPPLDVAIRSIALSPSGDQCVLGADDGEILLCDTRHGDLLQTLLGHVQPVDVLRFSRDGKLLLSGSSDGNVRLWRK